VIIIGAGHLGQALANYAKFAKLGFVITALFDVAPELIGQRVRGIPVLSMEDLPDYIHEHPVDIAALTMPKLEAEPIANQLVELGVHAIWNFAHVDLVVDHPDVVVENVHLADSLMQLSYNTVKKERM
jgi:redox-sensing transcriptional repressor